jgi:hypothetical protein
MIYIFDINFNFLHSFAILALISRYSTGYVFYYSTASLSFVAQVAGISLVNARKHVGFFSQLLAQAGGSISLILVCDGLVAVFDILWFWFVWIDVQWLPLWLVFTLQFEFSLLCPLDFSLFQPSLLWTDLGVFIIDLFVAVERRKISFDTPAVVFTSSDHFDLSLGHSFLCIIDYLLLLLSFNLLHLRHDLFCF